MRSGDSGTVIESATVTDPSVDSILVIVKRPHSSSRSWCSCASRGVSSQLGLIVSVSVPLKIVQRRRKERRIVVRFLLLKSGGDSVDTVDCLQNDCDDS